MSDFTIYSEVIKYWPEEFDVEHVQEFHIRQITVKSSLTYNPSLTAGMNILT